MTPNDRIKPEDWKTQEIQRLRLIGDLAHARGKLEGLEAGYNRGSGTGFLVGIAVGAALALLLLRWLL